MTEYDEQQMQSDLDAAKLKGLFNREYYEAHCGQFPSELDAFKDYIFKSTFSNVNPSALFDTEGYMRANIDVYYEGISPLLHYIHHGEKDNRRSFHATQRWVPQDALVANETSTWQEQKIAIVLHIFYPDFVEKFAQSIAKLPIQVDVFVTAATETIAEHCQQVFVDITAVNAVKTAIAPNRGRNFGPFLVEFAEQLQDYDLMCHLHSKKSLYSGREQTQWFDYLHQYLLNDVHVVSCLLRLFDEHQDLGMYYPTSFWMMPSWVNHWTCNKHHAQPFVEEWGIELDANFLNYPVGGMFWARPKAILPLLEKSYAYEDFPAEPLPNDGSYLHALERTLGLLAEKQGYKQFFYHPPGAKFTSDGSYIYANYFKPPQQLWGELRNFDIVSFDLFDTLLQRKYVAPDYAKLQLGELLEQQGIVPTPQAFVKMRNAAEHQVRVNKHFVGDVVIHEVYELLRQQLQCDAEQSNDWLAKEFEFDLLHISAKAEMVDVVNELSDLGREIWFVSDTYYSIEQISLLLRHAGIAIPHELFVSSALGKRKDNGQMWAYLKNYLASKDKSMIHVGDNVTADAQICGDHGFPTMHILHPCDKWRAAGFEANPITQGKLDKHAAIKWGSLMRGFGRYPFFGN